jgi:hypothetical protein
MEPELRPGGQTLPRPRLIGLAFTPSQFRTSPPEIPAALPAGCWRVPATSAASAATGTLEHAPPLSPSTTSPPGLCVAYRTTRKTQPHLHTTPAHSESVDSPAPSPSVSRAIGSHQTQPQNPGTAQSTSASPAETPSPSASLPQTKPPIAYRSPSHPLVRSAKERPGESQSKACSQHPLPTSAPPVATNQPPQKTPSDSKKYSSAEHPSCSPNQAPSNASRPLPSPCGKQYAPLITAAPTPDQHISLHMSPDESSHVSPPRLGQR